MTSPTTNQSRAIADAATTPATILVILCVGALCLVAMDVAGLNVGICVAAAIKAVWGFTWRAGIVVAGVLCVGAAMGSRR